MKANKTYSSQSAVAVSNASSTALVPAAPSRVALIVSAPSVAASRITISMASTAVLDAGIDVFVGTLPLILTLEDHGDIVQRAWTSIASAAGVSVGVIQVFDAG